MTVANMSLAPEVVGVRAAEILAAITSDSEFGRLSRSAAAYANCCATFNGYPTICHMNLATDAEPLVVEAARVLALKAAVYELSGGDEQAAELPVSLPVDQMVHAVLAQYTLCVHIQQRLGIQFIHMTDLEQFNWEPGDYTEQCYLAAGWGEPDPRYWISAGEIARRSAILEILYRSIGIYNSGQATDFDFQ